MEMEEEKVQAKKAQASLFEGESQVVNIFLFACSLYSVFF